jgi:hypothetical protein
VPVNRTSKPITNQIKSNKIPEHTTIIHNVYGATLSTIIMLNSTYQCLKFEQQAMSLWEDGVSEQCAMSTWEDGVSKQAMSMWEECFCRSYEHVGEVFLQEL